MRLRILLIGNFESGHLPDSYARAFERLDIQVFRFDSDRAYFGSARVARSRLLRRAFRPMLWNALNRMTVEVARTVAPHAIMAVKCAYLHPDTVFRLRHELRVPVVNYYPDNPYCGVPLDPRKTSAQRRDLIEVLREYTRLWIWEPALARRLAADGVSASYLPFGVDADIFAGGAGAPQPCAECGAVHDVVFIGQHSAKREDHLAAVAGHRVAIWGNRWSRAVRRFAGRHTLHQAAAWGQACAARYAGAQVSLNVLDDLNMPGHNMRSFEVPGSGGLMLATHTAEQAAIFPEGEAALYYRDPGEIDGLVARALEDEAFASRLRQRAAAIAAQHTYTHRARAILSEIGLA